MYDHPDSKLQTKRAEYDHVRRCSTQSALNPTKKSDHLHYLQPKNCQLNLNPTLLTSLATTSPSQGINFAIGGSKSGQGNSFVPFLPLPGVLEQVKLLTSPVQELNSKLDSNALYAIWGGANDYLSSGVTNINQTVNNLTSAVGLLTQAGAKNIMVLNLPDLGKTSQALNAGTSSNLTALTEKHNATLESALIPFSSNPELNIIPVDVNNISQ